MSALDARLVKANPVLGLAGAREALSRLSARELAAVADVLVAIQAEARQLADKSWSTGKGPMAAYWRAVGVYCGHIARATRHAEKS